jgi:hypothetical protein
MTNVPIKAGDNDDGDIPVIEIKPHVACWSCAVRLIRVPCWNFASEVATSDNRSWLWLHLCEVALFAQILALAVDLDADQ